MKFTFSKKKLDPIVLPDFPNMNANAGQEHYKLLNEFASRLADPVALIYDVGTHKGHSALSLAYQTDATVVSYDLTDEFYDYDVIQMAEDYDVHFHIGDVLRDPNLLESDLILLDTDHDGSFENEFYCHIRRDFKGFLLLDDIHLNSWMSNFWKSIPERKIDLTPVGHYTGTGLIIFE